MSRKRIKGVLKKYRPTETDAFGYRPVWETGKVSENKRKSRIRGINFPST